MIAAAVSPKERRLSRKTRAVEVIFVAKKKNAPVFTAGL
jgi:hypothetical protein